MGTFLLVLFIVGILIAGMSIGVIFGRKPISGTCGGIGAWASASPAIFVAVTRRSVRKAAARPGPLRVAKTWPTTPRAQKSKRHSSINKTTHFMA